MKGLNLNVTKQPHPTPDLQDVQRERSTLRTHRGAINKLWEALQDNGPGFSQQTQGEKQMLRSYADERAAAAKWGLLSESSFHQQTLYPPQHVCPHPIKVLVLHGYP